MDFYKDTSSRASRLSGIEHELFNYTTRNLHLVKDMSIREFAKANFVSTSTVLRYVRKLGYTGWSEFQQAVRSTETESRKLIVPSIVQKENYSESYLKNIIEAIKVITDEKKALFDQIMNRYPTIFILGSGLSEEIGHYCYRLLKMIGYNVEFPRRITKWALWSEGLSERMCCSSFPFRETMKRSFTALSTFSAWQRQRLSQLPARTTM